jgi:nucleoside-diphosphate-sugar epimerase
MKSPTTRARLRVAVAGATGFVGRALVAELSRDCDVVALGRGSHGTHDRGSGVEWRRCDLFSLREVETALAGCDVGVYLVHSMMPSARLTQARFEDLDLVLADNFGRAAARCSVERIVYLAGSCLRARTSSRPI